MDVDVAAALRGKRDADLNIVQADGRGSWYWWMTMDSCDESTIWDDVPDDELVQVESPSDSNDDQSSSLPVLFRLWMITWCWLNGWRGNVSFTLLSRVKLRLNGADVVPMFFFNRSEAITELFMYAFIPITAPCDAHWRGSSRNVSIPELTTDGTTKAEEKRGENDDNNHIRYTSSVCVCVWVYTPASSAAWITASHESVHCVKGVDQRCIEDEILVGVTSHLLPLTRVKNVGVGKKVTRLAPSGQKCGRKQWQKEGESTSRGKEWTGEKKESEWDFSLNRNLRTVFYGKVHCLALRERDVNVFLGEFSKTARRALNTIVEWKSKREGERERGRRERQHPPCVLSWPPSVISLT